MISASTAARRLGRSSGSASAVVIATRIRPFQTLRELFEHGLTALAANQAIEVDLANRSETEFVAEIFVNGKRTARCRVWIGGMMGSSNEIGYYEGDHDSGNTLNEALTIADERDGLALTALMNMGLGASRLPPGLDPHA